MWGSKQRSSMNDTKADTRTRQEELGQFLTARPVLAILRKVGTPDWTPHWQVSPSPSNMIYTQ